MVFIYKVNGVDKEFTEKDLMSSLPKEPNLWTEKTRLSYRVTFPSTISNWNWREKTKLIWYYPKKKHCLSWLMIWKSQSRSDAKTGQTVQERFGKRILCHHADRLVKWNHRVHQKKYGLTLEVLFCDATALKTIERANPSFVILNYELFEGKSTLQR